MIKLPKIFIVVIGIAIIVIGGYSFYLGRRIEQQASNIAELELKYNEAQKEINQNANQLELYSVVIQKLDSDYAVRKEIEGEPSYQEYKGRIQFLLDKRIGEIVSGKPLHEGNWFVTKVQFIGPTFALVYYEDGHDLFTVLIQILKTDSGYKFEKIE